MLGTDMRKSISGILGIIPAILQVEIRKCRVPIGGNHVCYFFIGLQGNKKINKIIIISCLISEQNIKC
jgi:hypothetical protein